MDIRLYLIVADRTQVPEIIVKKIVRRVAPLNRKEDILFNPANAAKAPQISTNRRLGLYVDNDGAFEATDADRSCVIEISIKTLILGSFLCDVAVEADHQTRGRREQKP